jgi:predicted DNA-binding transcriptional regulator YafY
VGRKKVSQPIANLALDRIIKIDYDFQMPFLEQPFNPENYYKNVIGVTVNSGLQPKPIQLWIDQYNAPYVITKPLHRSQRLLKQNEDGSIIINLFLIENYEMERILLGFGDGLEVLKPERLRLRIKSILEKSLKRYDENKGSQLS